MAIAEVIKYDGAINQRWLIYRYQNQEINDKSKLIVGPGQIGVLVHGGKVEHIYESGTYTLSSENFPFLKGLNKKVYGGNVPYTLEVYFINRTMKLDMLWGTNDPIQIIDPQFKVKVKIRARGQYALRINNYQFLLTNLVGALGSKGLIEFDLVNNLFRALINTKVKTIISKYILEQKISTLDISLYLEKIAQDTFESLKDEIARYGMELVNFYYESINVPNEDLDRINDILNKNAEFNILGEQRYRTARGFDVLESAANNEGAAGSIASLGAGLGMGVGVGKVASDLVSNTLNPQDSAAAKPKTVQCVKCNAMIEDDDKFCPECGAMQKLVCSNCKIELAPNAKFCPECGKKVGE